MMAAVIRARFEYLLNPLIIQEIMDPSRRQGTPRPNGVKANVWVFDGEIGSGKTTLIEVLASSLEKEGFEVVIVPEPVKKWKDVGVLQEFYEVRPLSERKYIAYGFQTYTFVTRIMATIEAVKSNPKADIYLLERSVLTDRYVFMELQRELVGSRWMSMYEEWWSLWNKLMPILPTHFIYLKPSIGECMNRVFRRAREGEVAVPTNSTTPLMKDNGESAPANSQQDDSGCGGVSREYQERLRMAHEAYLQGKHEKEFTEMPVRPFKFKDVLVVGGDLANGDFSVQGESQEKIIKAIADHIRPLARRN